MSKNLGPDVSIVSDSDGYSYDMVVFQKEKPPLDSELNLIQQLRRDIDGRMMSVYPSGWISFYPYKTDRSLLNGFYTQDPDTARPEYALVDGMVVHVTNTGTSKDNLNLISLGNPPSSGNEVNGVILEAWRALLDPDLSTNKPNPESVIESLYGIHIYDENNGWIVGQHGLILNTQNGGQTWNAQPSDTRYDLRGIFFITSAIGWAVGDNGFIARTSSGGTRWTSLTQATTENLNSVCAISQLKAWAVGQNGIVLKTINGVTWTLVNFSVTVNLNKIFFYDNLVGWIVGDNGTILKTTDGGSSWVVQTSGTTTNINSIYFYDLNYGFAIGDSGLILKTSDGGSSWVDQSGNVFDGSGYVRVSENLNDVHMAPTLDHAVTDEEVSHQLDGTNTDFTVANAPITKGDGHGTITNDVDYITVKVNGYPVQVDSMNGTTGHVVLKTAPGLTDTVLVTYYYRGECTVFRGRAWIVGDSGRVLYTDDIGAKWTEQNPQTSYDLNGVRFVDQVKGWTAGDLSVIRYTENNGITWSVQQSQVVVKEIQRVYYEGNVGSSVYLEDNSIHPDANVETTKRVQIQYKIRVIENVDPISNPEAGLSASISGLGPNTTGTYGYENMGSVNGDYGLWRARCTNTVDGYVYAIPMFFIARRNSATYDIVSNPNGSHQINSENVRPDMLTATEIADQDILDVRRKVVSPSSHELLDINYDRLSRNELKMKLAKPLTGATRYGTELMQIDRISGISGGDSISGTLSDAVLGNINSESSIETSTTELSASTTVPADLTITVSGLIHPDLSRNSAVYEASGSLYNGKPVPGYFERVDDDKIKFVFRSYANTIITDPNLTKYIISVDYIKISGKGLTYLPSKPLLSKNTSGTGSQSFFYQGCFSESTCRIEEWNSEVSGYTNYVMAYPAADSSDSSQKLRASTVEIHYFKIIKSTDLSPAGTSSNKLLIDPYVYPVSGDVPWAFFGVSKINNITSGFSYKIKGIKESSGKIEVESVSGFPFFSGTVIEIIAPVKSDLGSNNTRNGASLNFVRASRKIEKFCKALDIVGSTGSGNSVTFTTPNSELFLGVLSVETTTALSQHVCWIESSMVLRELTVTGGYGTTQITGTISGASIVSGTNIKIQALVQETALTYSVDANGDGLYVAYNRIPYQSLDNLPSTLDVDIVAKPAYVCISNLGSGGDSVSEPYESPIDHIPVNNSLVINDAFFTNKLPLIFSAVSINGGYCQMPAYVPGSTGVSVTLSEESFDQLQRHFYGSCSVTFKYSTEGLQMAVPRKVYIPMIGRVASANNRIMKGENILLIFSRDFTSDKENNTGYESDSRSAISIYRLPGKPITRI